MILLQKQKHNFRSVAVLLAATGVILVSSSVGFAAEAQSIVRGMVHDGDTNDPIALANVSIVGTDRGAATNEKGQFRFSLPSGRYSVAISALGYEKTTVNIIVADEPVVVHVSLYPAVLLHQEVMVEGRRAKTNELAADGALNSTEDLLGHIPGVDFIERANFAWEPVIRGMSGGQVGLVIDGIKVIGACVDKMDPTSAYVEVENLEKLELTKGGFDLSKASQVGGTVNMVTQKPTFNQTIYGSAESGFESSAALRRARAVLGASFGNTSVRGSFSYKVADDFHPGSRQAIRNSGFTKNNFKVDVAQRFGRGHTITASALADNAWHVGYPVLLMDATLAKARIYSLSHTWVQENPAGFLQKAETRLYTNSVNHWMDDFDRNVDERVVMRSMNMPMYGKTRTSGGISTISAKAGPNAFSLTLDAYRTSSFGEMWMFSTLPDISDMYLLNLGDIVVDNAAISMEYRTHLTSRLKSQLSARYDYSVRDVENETAQSILEGRWNLSTLKRHYSIPGISGTLEYQLAKGTYVRVSGADVGRLPTHVENYGHYIYNYTDGYFYSGNPRLRPERSRQIEIGFERITSRYGVRVNVFHNRLNDYILGSSDSGLTEDAGTYRFRVFDNISAATLTGVEVSGVLGLYSSIEVRGSASYTRGQNLEYDEPLPLIPPLRSTVALAYSNPTGWGMEVEGVGSAPQNRISKRASREDGTDGFFIVNLRGSYPIADRFTLKAGVENVFDVYYHEHLSFGNLPALGRNVFGAVSVTL